MNEHERDKPPEGTTLMGWTADMRLDDAAKEFYTKHGYEPEWIIRTAGAVLAGPVRESTDA